MKTIAKTAGETTPEKILEDIAARCHDWWPQHIAAEQAKALREAGLLAPMTFGPGDMVRNRASGWVYTITQQGLLQHLEWRHFDRPGEVFDSRCFDLIRRADNPTREDNIA